LSSGFPIVVVDGVPTVDESWPPIVSTGTLAGYRTMTARDIALAAGAETTTQPLYDLSLPAALYVMEQLYGDLNGVLILESSNVPYLAASGQDGYPVQWANSVPYYDDTQPQSSGITAGPMGAQLWLARNFGAR